MKRFFEWTVSILIVIASVFVFGYCGWGLHSVVAENEERSTVAVEESSGTKEDKEPPSEVPDDADTPVEELPLSEDEVFIKFTEEYWSDITEEELEKIAEELSLLISYDLALENPPIIEIINESEISYSGSYSKYYNRIRINMYQIYAVSKVFKTEPAVYFVETVAHEHRHAYQAERVDRGFDTKLELSYKNYITAKDDYTAYRKQLVELDARNYGDYWESLLIFWLEA